jgi:hypothetical protein
MGSSRRNLLVLAGSTLTASFTGCLTQFSEFDIYLSNLTESSISGQITVTNQNSKRVVLDEDIQLAPDRKEGDTKTYSELGKGGVSYLVEISVEPDLSGEHVWQPGVSGTRGLEIGVKDQQIAFNEFVG